MKPPIEIAASPQRCDSSWIFITGLPGTGTYAQQCCGRKVTFPSGSDRSEWIKVHIYPYLKLRKFFFKLSFFLPSVNKKSCSCVCYCVNNMIESLFERHLSNFYRLTINKYLRKSKNIGNVWSSKTWVWNG